MKLKNILLGCVIIFGSLTLSGCYTQLTMFQPDPKIEQEGQFYSYSAAGPLRSVGMYAQDGAGTSLGLAYQLMYNRFRGFMGFGNRYNYYNPYYYGGYYNDYSFNSYTLGGYTMYVPLAKFPDKGTPRKWSRDGKSSTTNLTTTRTTTESNYNSTNNSTNNNTNSSNVSSTRSSSGGSSSSSSSSGGRRVTKRN